MTEAELDKLVETTSLHVHHTSLSRGYICKGYASIDKYEGRFGKGFVFHQENCKNKVSNNYHYVTYYVY